jgi:amphi-Trp domain-containing protein
MQQGEGKMGEDRDVERQDPRERFVDTLRRIADAVEEGTSFRIQVRGERFTVPADAEWSIEHEREDGEEELELQFKWTSGAGDDEEE